MSRWIAADVIACLDSLRRYARVLSPDPTAADDLVQEALLTAYERSASFNPAAPLKPWLLAILHNVHAGGRRRAATRDRALDSLAREAVAVAPPRAEHAIALRELATQVADLPQEQRAVLHLIVVEELSYREAADALAVPIGTVMSRLGRARKTLRERQQDDKTNVAELRLIGGKDVG